MMFLFIRFLVLGVMIQPLLAFFISDSSRGKVVTISWSASSDEQERLLDEASKLRKEAAALESTITRLTDENNTPDQVVYKNIKDSTWRCTFRFSTEPEPTDENSGDSSKPRRFLSGQITLLFRDDGYTDIVEQESKDLKIVKAWGWDVETSSEDDKEYLLFSVDAKVDQETQRFYMQARQTKTKSNEILLDEGTVTIKQDVSKGNWGFFSPKGILAQFRLVGNFVAKPVSGSKMS